MVAAGRYGTHRLGEGAPPRGAAQAGTTPAEVGACGHRTRGDAAGRQQEQWRSARRARAVPRASRAISPTAAPPTRLVLGDESASVLSLDAPDRPSSRSTSACSPGPPIAGRGGAAAADGHVQPVDRAGAAVALPALRAFVATLRVDALHQCNASSPLYYTVGNREPGLRGQVGVGAWFKGTALVVLDASYATLGWTWLLVSPEKQISRADPNATSRWHVPLGAAGRFGPPWAAPVYDARIFNFKGTLFSSQVCKACDFSVTQLRLAADPTADGGVANLQAWATRRFVVREGWAAGHRPGALCGAAGGGVADGACLQPWLGLVGSLGRPRYKVETVNCTEKNFRVRHNGHGGKGSRLVCGTHIGPALPVAAIENDMHAPKEGTGWFGQLELVSNG